MNVSFSTNPQKLIPTTISEFTVDTVYRYLNAAQVQVITRN